MLVRERRCDEGWDLLVAGGSEGCCDGERGEGVVDRDAESALDVVSVQVAEEVRWWERVAAGMGYVEPTMLHEVVSFFENVGRIPNGLSSQDQVDVMGFDNIMRERIS